MRSILSRCALIIATGTILLLTSRAQELLAQIITASPSLEKECPGSAYMCISGFAEECCSNGKWACPDAEGQSSCTR